MHKPQNTTSKINTKYRNVKDPSNLESTENKELELICFLVGNDDGDDVGDDVGDEVGFVGFVDGAADGDDVGDDVG